MRCRHSSGIWATTAVVALWCTPPVSPFTTSHHVSRTSKTGAPPFAPASIGRQRRWPSSMARTRRRQRDSTHMSGSRKDANSDFDPLEFYSLDSGSSSTSGPLQRTSVQPARGVMSRRLTARSSLHATKSGINDGDGPPRERGAGTKGGLRAIKIGMDEVAEVHASRATAQAAEPEPSKGVSVAKGWDYWKYRVLLLGVALLWGTNFPAVKFIEQHGEVSDATAAFVRFAIAAGASLPFADLGEREVLFAGMEIGAWVALGYFTQAIGLQTSDASVCAFLCSLTVVVVPLLDAVTGKGIKRVTVAASFLALLGTGFLELGDAHASWNDLWCVAQAIGFGVAFTRIEHYMEKFPGKSLQLSIGQLLSVAGLTGIWCVFSAGGHLPDFSFMKDPPVMGALAYTGLVTTSLAIWLETICLEKVPAAEMSVIFSTEPLWATLVSGVFLKETMGPNALVGAGVILLACLVAQSEQISELLGIGRGKDDPTDGDGGDETFHLNGAEEDEMDPFPSSVLDEVDRPQDTEVKPPFEVSMVREYSLPQGAHVGGPSPGDRHTKANDASVVRTSWFGFKEFE
ncbi:unnamed protein product [Scytosiphon promiscuus]